MAKKRKSGTGTVRQRGDGRWEGRVVIGYDDNGLPKTKNVLAKTKRECQEKLRQLTESMVGRNDRKVKSDMLFGDWLCYWYETHSKPTLRASTQNNYENVIYNHVLPEIGKIPLNKLSQNDLQQFYGRLKKNGRKRLTEQYGAGLSDRMVRMCHAVCRSALERAVRDDLLRTNPAIGCKLPPKKAREMQVLTREELQRFLIQAKFEGYYEVFLLDLATGLRRGEIQTISTDHCSFTLAQKDAGREDFTKIPGGLPGVETRGELIYSYGVAAKKLSLAQMCRVVSENPAKLYGLYPRKGVLAPGSDADIVIYDPGDSHVIRAEDCVANVDYNPYEGFVTAGGIREVWLRGRKTVENGKVLDTVPAGMYLARGKCDL